ncbi:MAG: hypothetical protein B6U65_02020 [Candidatus Wolframiiraptor sp. EX4484-121]|nr:MAG: hypothetical protein B6U65_02020 [Candidatus Wolframiiraptor sp. EX4484-121]
MLMILIFCGMGDRVWRIIKTISDMYEIDLERFRRRKPFELLVAVILSQRTSRENVRKAMERFTRRFNDVEDVANARLREIEDAIRPAGIWRMKAIRIRKMARQLLKLEGGLDSILKKPYPEAKKILSSMEGIGPKTADVFLMAARDEPVLPIDTHIFRIMRRLGVADERDDYESLRLKLETATPPALRMKAHLALIEFGRNICRARNPRCLQCPLAEICPSREDTNP